MFVYLGWAGLALLVWLRIAYVGVRKLAAYPPATDELPLLSIVVAARNEEQTVQAALQSLLSLDYPHLEIVFVNDRSTDGTAAILDACPDARLRVLHLDRLPSGWLGKNHALHCGAAVATGELLLFTDADVVFAPECLRRAVHALQRLQVDHLVLTPTMLNYTFWEKAFISYFPFAFGLRFCPGWVWLPSRQPYVGVGAFNLVRSAAYRAVGGHERLRLSIVDDVELGGLLKACGFRQRCLDGSAFLSVYWTAGLSGIISGLEKNIYAGFGYSLPLACASLLVTLVSAVTPFALLAQGEWELLLGLVTTALASSDYLPFLGAPRWGALLFPFGALLFCCIIANSVYKVEKAGGVRWRDTFYPLHDLRAFQPGK